MSEDSQAIGTSLPYVSIIIPVYHDGDRLLACLSALDKQTYDHRAYEVIVVNNDPKTPLRSLDSYSVPVTALLEEQAGSYAARNSGIAAAKGSVLAFTDADCLPEPDWIEEGVAQLNAMDNPGLAAGRISLYFLDPDHPNAIELFESVTIFDQEKSVLQHGYGATANLFTYRSVMNEVGVFDPQRKSGGDLEWGQRVKAHGYQLGYARKAVVQHPARDTLRDLSRRGVRIAGASQATRGKRHGRVASIFKIPGFLFPWRRAQELWRHASLRSPWDRIRVITILLTIRWVKLGERIRVALGGSPLR